MAAATPLFPVREPSRSDEARVLLNDVSWAMYVMLRDSTESGAVRMTFLEGRLEIMTPSPEHEISKKQIARLLELFCLERNIPLFAYGSTTFRKEEQKRGLEADEGYCRGKLRSVPDVAVEVIVSNALLDKLEVYRGLGVPEVWTFRAGRIRVLVLEGERYAERARSGVFPEVDLERTAHYAMQEDQPAALTAFRDELRGA